MKTSLTIAMVLLALTGTAQASPLHLGYSGFFKHMKTVQKARLEHAELGFYLSRTEGEGICTINSGTVRVDDISRGEVIIMPHGQFVLPYDNELHLDKAVVELDVAHPEQCDIAVQIQANLAAGDISMARLGQVRDEMHTLLQKMAGWPGKYFVPELKGIKLHPAEVGQQLNGMEQLTLSNTELTGEHSLSLPAVRITPWF